MKVGMINGKFMSMNSTGPGLLVSKRIKIHPEEDILLFIPDHTTVLNEVVFVVLSAPDRGRQMVISVGFDDECCNIAKDIKANTLNEVGSLLRRPLFKTVLIPEGEEVKMRVKRDNLKGEFEILVCLYGMPLEI